MIYLDNSATTYPKPQSVTAAVMAASRNAANPGRSGHRMSMNAAKQIYEARCTAARLFSLKREEQVIFTENCTAGLNTAIKGLAPDGCHIVVSELEHNAVMRPLNKLSKRGISFTKARVFPGDDDKTVDSFRQSINAKTKMIVCTQASNVWGIRLPVERLCALAHAYGLLFIVDAAQSAGVIPIDMNDGYDAVCTAGHKGLYGPMGTGLMLLGDGIMPETLTEGGTGSNSISLEQPEELPDRFESGTPNYPGIMGLDAGMKFVMQKGIESISKHEFSLMSRLYDGLSQIKDIHLYTQRPEPEHFVPVISFNVGDTPSEEAAARLSERGIAVRAGLHCCPSAHEAFGTLEQGTVRISPSAFTKPREIDYLLECLSGTRRLRRTAPRG